MKPIVACFNRATRQQFLDSDKTRLGNKSNVKNIKKDDTVLLFDWESDDYFGIVTIGEFADGTSCRENYIPNIDGTYSGEYVEYSKFEIPVGKFYSWKMSCDGLINALGINRRLNNNIVKKSNVKSFTKAFYGPKVATTESKRVLDGFHFIVETVMSRSS
jgi:hypothetical protein